MLRVGAVVACVGVFLAGADLAVTALIGDQTARQLSELSKVALRRSEAAIDSAGAILNRLVAKGPMDCSANALQALRLHVYQGTIIKDIRTVDREGSVKCAAYSETLEFDNGWARRDEMFQSADGELRLFRVEQFTGAAFGVLHDIDAQRSLAAILRIDGNLLDVMPVGLRGESHVTLTLPNGEEVASYHPDAPSKPPAQTVAFTTTSDRYPLQATIHVRPQSLSARHEMAYQLTMLAAGWLGAVFGLLLASYLNRPVDPVAELDRALAANEFKPYVQPTFRLKTGDIVGCEILARWEKPDGRLIPPMSFIPLAESSGRIEKLTWQLLRTALRELQPEMKQDKLFKLSVNVTPRHLLGDGFVDDLRKVVASSSVSTRQVVLEVTEREELADLEKATDVVKELGEFGFRIALDDVGIGHSGLSYIQRLGARILKIDKFFVDAITRDQSAVVVVQMLVALARELEMSVVAEGIEHQEQVDALIACGVEEGQGYLVAPPLSIDRFKQFLDVRRAAVGAKRTAKPELAA
ncbi:MULTISPECIES: EAL domain-containing protein [unclassified Bradyrhizobium]|uniref:EAL domain-containing protein n=1 Tax=unclassified Bradyrhizobium TaxID=2631580 RepID=UPI0024E0BA08|nr:MULTISPECIES: EAL domain-containing protein [unclassified Bradyrhizobium]